MTEDETLNHGNVVPLAQLLHGHKEATVVVTIITTTEDPHDHGLLVAEGLMAMVDTDKEDTVLLQAAPHHGNDNKMLLPHPHLVDKIMATVAILEPTAIRAADTAVWGLLRVLAAALEVWVLRQALRPCTEAMERTVLTGRLLLRQAMLHHLQ